MKEITKYQSEDGELFNSADEALERDEQVEVAKFLERSDLFFMSDTTPLAIVQELQKRYIFTKKESQ